MCIAFIANRQENEMLSVINHFLWDSLWYLKGIFYEVTGASARGCAVFFNMDEWIINKNSLSFLVNASQSNYKETKESHHTKYYQFPFLQYKIEKMFIS